MTTTYYEHVDETVIHETLDNGLQIFIVPKPKFAKTYALFATKYGSLDLAYIRDNEVEPTANPAGIAHFLEHKMFEEPEGDIFTTFATQGASANAYTSLDRTVYLFSATSNVEKNLTTLLDFVQHPYFTDDNVAKEQGIIVQEINMYQDHPDYRAYYALLAALYSHHPINTEIIGTAESIGQITPQMLFDAHATFYHPSNMSLFLVGNVDPERVLHLIHTNQSLKMFPPPPKLERTYAQDSNEVAKPFVEITIPIATPKFVFGMKDAVATGSTRSIARELALDVVLESIFGKTSKFYQSLYDAGLITDSFGVSYTAGTSYGYSMISGDSHDPELVLSKVKQQLTESAEQGIDPVAFERARRKVIGGLLRSFNQLESLANNFVRYQLCGMNVFDLVPLLEAIKLEDATAWYRMHVDTDSRSATVIVRQAVGDER